MRNSLENSLKNLRTDYVDIFYVHWWNYTTSIEEVTNGLHNLVVQGRTPYLDRRRDALTFVTFHCFTKS